MSIDKILNPILSLSRSKRLVILLFLDFSIIFSSFYLSIWLSVSNNIINKLNNISILIIFTLSLISLGIYYKSAQYRSLTSYIGSNSFYKLLIVNLLISFIFYFSNSFYIYKFDLRIYLIFWIFISF